MADAIDRLLRSLEDSFEAHLDADERAAAADLALSLLQDQSLREVAPRGPGLVAETSEGRFEVGTVGLDFVADRTRAIYQRLDDVVLVQDDAADPPIAYEGCLLEALRGRSRQRPFIEIRSTERHLSGVLERVGRDHLVLLVNRRRVIFPERSVRSVRCAREG